MKNEPGYPLPLGELGEDEIVCQLVFLPNRPEYWQALVGALGYMATWRAWERDSDKRGKDAASNWSAAFELTMECWRMACLQDLQDNVAEILAIMQLGNQCCDDQDITDGDRYTDRVEDGEGDVPQPIIDAGYAEDAADWDGFDDYKCMIAHVTVDQMEARLREIDEVLEDAGPYLAVAAALSAILGVIVATGGLAIVFGLLAGIGTVSALYYALIEFGVVGDLADEVATNHDELACAVYFGDGDDDALVNLNAKIDDLFTAPEALILKNMNLGPTLKSLYAGRYDQQDIAEILEAAGYDTGDFDCSPCGEETWGEFFHESPFLTSDLGRWVNTATNWTGEHEGCRWMVTNGSGRLRMGVAELRDEVGLSGTENGVFIRSVRVDYKMSNSAGGQLVIGVYQSPSGWHFYNSPLSVGVWVQGSVEIPLEGWESDYGDYCVWVGCQDSGSAQLYVDNIEIDFDALE